MSPARRRRAVAKVRRAMPGRVSERRACAVLGQARSTQRYAARRRDGEEALRRRIRELALRHPRYGYRRIAALLRREGKCWRGVNVKRVHRLWKLEGLRVPQKQRKRRRPVFAQAGVNASHGRRRARRANHVWSYDFCFDRTADGRELKILSVLDEYTRRCLATEVGRRMTGLDVVRTLGALMALFGVPGHVRSDNGPEFVASAVRAWLAKSKVRTLYVAPGAPWENAYSESFHARLRDEVLDRTEFGSLAEARSTLEAWRGEYNEQRPHGSLGYKTPDEAFAAAGRRVAGRAGPGSATPRRARHGPRRDEEEPMVSVAR